MIPAIRSQVLAAPPFDARSNPDLRHTEKRVQLLDAVKRYAAVLCWVPMVLGFDGNP